MSGVTIKSAIKKTLRENQGERAVSFEFEGQRYWLKQIEQPTGAMRWLKANPIKSLRLEIASLQTFQQTNAPVAKLIDFGDNYLVVSDVGHSLNQFLFTDSSADEKQASLIASAVALAKLHQQGFSHGRPVLRDICWKEGHAFFIDFESHQLGTDIDKQQQRDLLVYIHSLFRYLGPQLDIIDPVIEAYRLHGGESIWQASQSKILRWHWVQYLFLPFKNFGGKDLRPVYWLFRHFKLAGKLS
ncbi:serine/threonine protein phosphatase [Shewanella sp. Isolate11]|uniref:serine/threonine protein phosphatase n=1 Tax=Shewanella sp. Isolate11 TaxID=2908530 RepID=UPI001EFD8B1B|nr:serine/threonine protein phosphatase [Shewanella sp. Isolate11]MCG9696938.1 serine/threonine protein phosphatase [Shewanella sp. Isolate11]